MLQHLCLREQTLNSAFPALEPTGKQVTHVYQTDRAQGLTLMFGFGETCLDLKKRLVAADLKSKPHVT